MNTARIYRIATMVAALVLLPLFVAPAHAAPPARHTAPSGDRCRPRTLITDWHSQRVIEARGFNLNLIGSQASADFGRTLKLSLSSNPASQAFTASRITEIEVGLPIGQRVKCWQATPEQNVVAEYRVRFAQAAAPAGLTETLFFWNSPLPNKSIPEPAILATAIGISRSSFNPSRTPQYQVVIAQDVAVSQITQTVTPTLVTEPMPSWLNATKWHRVRITLSQRYARVEIAQDGHRFVVDRTLPRPIEPLAFELSLDNEVFPGITAPVITADGLEVSHLVIARVPVYR